VSAAQNDTFSPQNLAVLGGLLFFALFLGEVVFPRDKGDSMDVGMSVGTMEDISMRLKSVVTLDDIMANASSGAAGAADKSPKDLYAGACLACHASGVAGAPKVGDAAAWESRMAGGVDALTTSAISGKGAMPPNGGSAYSPAQIRTVVEYMLAETGL
jgi:cytochrome c5